MKFFSFKSIAPVLVAVFLSGPVLAETRIATVDLRRVFDNYWKTKQADAALKERAADMEKEHTNMLNDWKKAKEEYQSLLTTASDQAVSADERDKRKKTAEDKLKYIKETEDTITQYERQARTTLDEQRKRMRENILGEIRTVLNAKGKAAGFSLVIDTAAESFNNTPIVLYTNNENDLTEALLTQLNLGAPAETPAKTEDKKDAKKPDAKK